MEDIPPHELDPIIASFFINVRQKGGKEYEPSTLRTMQSSFERQLRDAKYGHTIAGGHMFEESRKAIKGKTKHLKSLGKGNLDKAADPFTEEDINRCYESGELGLGTPISIINFLWMHLMMQCGMRADTVHRKLKWGDVLLMRDSSGVEHLQVRERVTKTKKGDKKDIVNKKVLYGNPLDKARCPVEAYKKYKAKRPPRYCKARHPLYLGVNTRPFVSAREQWFLSKAMGINKNWCTLQEHG